MNMTQENNGGRTDGRADGWMEIDGERSGKDLYTVRRMTINRLEWCQWPTLYTVKSTQ